MRRWLVTIAAASLVATPAAARPCSYAQARYVLQGDANVTAAFVRHGRLENITGDLFLRVTIKTTHRAYWFFFDQGSGDSPVTLISMADPGRPGWQPPDPDSRRGRPYSDQKFYAVEGDFSIRDTLPMSTGRAVPRFLIPELGPAVWDDLRDGNRYRMPRAFFRLDHCGKG